VGANIEKICYELGVTSYELKVRMVLIIDFIGIGKGYFSNSFVGMDFLLFFTSGKKSSTT
jgi:hypothetical protein